MSCGPIFCDQNDPYNNSNIFLNKNRAFLLKASQASKAINPYETPSINSATPRKARRLMQNHKVVFFLMGQASASIFI
jgi:hypothetical protein